ncbi:MAG: Hsp70 family protein, partial [Pirellulales bacterium]
MRLEHHEHEAAGRFIVGIDLGTTNSAVAYVDTADDGWQVHTFAVPQLVAPGEVEARETLPSFHYEAARGEFSANALKLPWQTEAPGFAVGVFARDHGTNMPGRQISSAKSWLCHPGVDRTAQLLPWHPAADVERLSPVEASARYLDHIRQAWSARFPNEPLELQDIVLTLPASFDEVARELTVRAAKLAGLPRVVLIEEPQAAFYAWIYHQGDRWAELVSPGQKILVCDIGGGTSDFTLIRVRHGEGGKIRFHRVAVGEHLLLGGDNLDLALAHHIERRLTGDGKLEPRQWAVLVRACRRAKEALLAADAPEKLVVNLPGSGARLIGGGLQVELTREEVE